MKVRVGARTDVGLVRQRNEDSYVVHEPLFAVADGMGGHRGGNVASALALEVIEGAGPGDDSNLLEAFGEANRQVFRRGEDDRDLQGMGTTVTALLLGSDGVLLAHVGDSRAYLLHDGELRQLTHDHTLVQRWVDEGRITPQDAERHPQRNVVTRALGVEDDLPVEEIALDVRPGDRILLCSDGLTGMVEDERIRDALERERDPQGAADFLVQMAIEAGGEDNVTVVVVDVDEVGGGEEPGKAAMDSTDPSEVARRAEARGAGPAPASKPGPRGRRPFPWKRTLLWVGGAAVVLAVAFVGVRSYLDRQWYVGDSDGAVAVFQGIPARPLGIPLSRVKARTAIPAAEAEQLQPWQDLSGGINVGSLREADRLVEQIRTDVSATLVEGTPGPQLSPTPGASPSAGGA